MGPQCRETEILKQTSLRLQVPVTAHREQSVKREKPTRCNSQMFIINFCINMFRASLCPSSGEQGPVTAFGVLFWFCWMWLVAVVGRCLAGCEHQSSHPARHPTRQDGRTTYQPVLTTFLQPRHIPTQGYNITQSSAPDDGHMVARNMLSNYQKRNKEYKK